MSKGTIKKLLTDKGFGFIARDGGDLFFHHSALEGCRMEELHEGQSVLFIEGKGPKGPCATTVKPA